MRKRQSASTRVTTTNKEDGVSEGAHQDVQVGMSLDQYLAIARQRDAVWESRPARRVEGRGCFEEHAGTKSGRDLPE